MTTIDNFTKGISDGFKVITSWSGKLSYGDYEVINRDAFLVSMSPYLISIRDGHPRRVLISGDPGTGRSYLLSFLSISMNRFDRVGVIHIPYSSCNRLSDFDTKTREPERKRDDTIPTTRIEDGIEEPCVIFIDDIDLMMLSWNTNGRFLKLLSWLSSVNRSVIATTSSTPPSLLGAIKWDDVIHVEPFSSQSIVTILTNLVQKNISKEIIVDDSAINLCALFAVKNFKSSISSAISIMERAAEIVEHEIITGSRDDRKILMKDIENGAMTLRSNRSNSVDTNNKLLIMATFFVMKRATATDLHSRVSKIIPVVYPDRNPPSIQTVRSVLNDMVSNGLSRKSRSSNGKSSGVKTMWICNVSAGQVKTAIPGEIERLMKLIAIGGKRNG